MFFTKNIKKNKCNVSNDGFEDKLNISLKVMSLLDAVMIPENKKYLRLVNYVKDKDIERYTINNGKGDSLVIILVKSDILVKGFDHENQLNQFSSDDWDLDFFKYVYSIIPDYLKKLLTDEEIDETTFVMWYDGKEKKWIQNEYENNDGGKKYLLSYVKNTADEWYDWASDYYKKNIDFNSIKKVYNTTSVSYDDIKVLNPDGDVEKIMTEIKKMYGEEENE